MNTIHTSKILKVKREKTCISPVNKNPVHFQSIIAPCFVVGDLHEGVATLNPGRFFLFVHNLEGKETEGLYKFPKVAETKLRG